MARTPTIIDTKTFLNFKETRTTKRLGINFKLTKGLTVRLSSQKKISEKTRAENMVTGIKLIHLWILGESLRFCKKSMGITLGKKEVKPNKNKKSQTLVIKATCLLITQIKADK